MDVASWAHPRQNRTAKRGRRGMPIYHGLPTNGRLTPNGSATEHMLTTYGLMADATIRRMLVIRPPPASCIRPRHTNHLQAPIQPSP